MPAEQFFVEAYESDALAAHLARAEKTPEQFQNEVLATIKAFCAEHAECIKGCVMDIYRETLGILYGVETHQFDLDDMITDQEWGFSQNRWPDVLVLQGPGATEEQLKDFSDSALKTHYTND